MEVEQKVAVQLPSSENDYSKNAVFSFGLIGDVQYALDVKTGENYLKTETRYFQDAINKLREAVSSWNKYSLNFCVNLGDLLDGRNQKVGTTEKAWKECSEALSKMKCKRRFDLVGNHELYCWATRKNMPDGLNIKDAKGCGWYAYHPAKGWRVLVLDSFVVSAIPGSENEKETMSFLKSKNPNIREKSNDWTKGLPPGSMHYLPYNGGLGKAQRLWLDDQLLSAFRDSERVIIFTHVEMIWTRTIQSNLLFDHEEVAEILQRYKGVVHSIFTGHFHEGAYSFHEKLQIHCYSIRCPLVVREGAACHAVCHVLQDGRIELEGFGEVKSVSLL